MIITMIKMLPSEIENFRAHVLKKGGCWIWTGAFFPESGYGSFYLKWTRNSFGAHRIAFFIANGYLTPRLLIRHTCNNRACVNPEHLIEGTHRQNMQDMVDAGRSLTGKKNPSITHNDNLARGKDNPYYKYDYVQDAFRAGNKKWRATVDYNGSKNPCAKLDETKVLDIREKFATGKYSKNELGRMYGTSGTNIAQIIFRKKWKHI